MFTLSNSQKFNSFEVICVNDGSTDDTLKIITKCSNSLPNLKIINQPNSGRGFSRNVGTLNAKGQFVVFLDSDDVIAKDYLDKGYYYLNITNADLMIFDMKYSDQIVDNSDQEVIVDCKEYIKLKIDTFQRSQSVCSTFISKEIFSRGIEFPNVRSFEDVFILHKIVNISQKPVIINAKGYEYMMNPCSITNNIDIGELLFLFDSLRDFHSHNKNINIVLFQERVLNLFKYIITKIKPSNKALFDRICVSLNNLISEYNLSEESIIYIIFLLKNKFKDSKLIKSNFSFLSESTLGFINHINSEDEFILNIINYLKEKKVSKFHLVGVGNSMYRFIDLFQKAELNPVNIYTDEFVHRDFVQKNTFGFDRLSVCDEHCIVIANFNSFYFLTDLTLNSLSIKLPIYNIYNTI